MTGTGIKERLKKIVPLKVAISLLRLFRNRHGMLTTVSGIRWFLSDFKAYRKLPPNTSFPAAWEHVYPRIYDKTTHTPLDPIYFYQNAWCASKIFKDRPSHHYDVASDIKMLGIVSEFVPTTVVDIRPLTIELSNLHFKKGDATALPFADNELKSLSSICVIEHIGLGRYGDVLDPRGTEKAAAELKRVLARGGSLYISVPIDTANRVYFNAHRAFTRKYILEMFSPLTLREEEYIYGNRKVASYQPEKGFGTGLFHFTK